jgi:hypothetical protein
MKNGEIATFMHVYKLDFLIFIQFDLYHFLNDSSGIELVLFQ